MEKITKAIILAGGEGTRLRPVTYEIPKSLLTVHKKPIISYLVELFAAYGVREVKVIIRSVERNEFEWWMKRWGRNHGKINISFEEEPKPMGTIGYVARYLGAWVKNETFFVTNGDELKEIDLAEMERHHREQKGEATLALIEVSNPHEYGVAVLDGHRITRFIEKPKEPPSNFINGGFYIFEPVALGRLNEQIKSGQEFLMSEKDLFPRIAAAGKLVAYKASGRWCDCGNFERWEKAMKEWPI